MWPATLDYLQANAGRIILALALVVISRKLYSMFQVRRLFYNLRKQGLVGHNQPTIKQKKTCTY